MSLNPFRTSAKPFQDPPEEDSPYTEVELGTIRRVKVTAPAGTYSKFGAKTIISLSREAPIIRVERYHYEYANIMQGKLGWQLVGYEVPK